MLEHELDEAADLEAEAVRLAAEPKVSVAAARAVRFRAPQCIVADLLPRDGLDDLGPGDVHVAHPVDHVLNQTASQTVQCSTGCR